MRLLPACLLAVTAAVPLAACGGSHGPETPTSGPVLEIASELPLQGGAKTSSEETNRAMQLYLEQVHSKAGAHTVRLKLYDNAIAARGGWDDETCVKNAVEHVRSAEVAVMGTYNSGCARLMVPVMNQATDGPLLMVSHANSNPGLTKAWGPNEPQKFAPSGTRSFARVSGTDDKNGDAGAEIVKSILHASRCYIVNDGQAYGVGVAKAFASSATAAGITVLGNQAWDLGKSSYVGMFQPIAALHPDCVYLAGDFSNNGEQLVKDKVAVLGDNSKVHLVAPDGFASYPKLDEMPQADGMYVTFGGLSVEQMLKLSPAATAFVAAYQQRYGSAPTSSYPLYSVAALQVILTAIEKSDGTRKGVDHAVFGATNLTVPAASSITGQDLTIDHASGDLTSTTMSILQIRGGKESLVRSQAVS